MPVYKNKERNTWYCSFYYQDWTGKRKKKKKEGFATKREAQAFERNFLSEYAGMPDITFETLVKAYLDKASLRVKASTLANITTIIKIHMLPFFGDMQINDITAITVSAWHDSLIKKELSISYMQTLHAKLTTLFAFAVKYYSLPKNPARIAGNIQGTKNKRMDFWTLDEFRKFAMCLKKPLHIMAFYTLFWSGMRVGELLALTWSDIDFEKKTISISKTLYMVNGKQTITTPKTVTSNRTITMPNFIMAMLKDYKNISHHISISQMFPIREPNLLGALKRTARLAGIKPIRVHDLRHSHASMLINAGCTPLEVANRLGHKSPAMTLNVYSHMYQSKQSQIADMLNTMS